MMKTKRTMTQHVHVLMASIAILFLFIPYCHSSIHEDANIPLNGNWDTNSNGTPTDRSLPTIPIIAYLYNNYISIENEKPDCDITINIINCTTGDIVYQQITPKAATSNILIPINNLTSGEYILELTGPDTRHLEGYFSK